MKEYHYINDLGTRKCICVYPLEGDQNPFIIWNEENGELAGSGRATPQELKEFLFNYGIEYQI